MTLKQTITHNLLNIPGWRTNRHIVVIESDDWGSIRMPSKEVYDRLLKEGYRVDKNCYERYDSLATEDDLTALFEVLEKYKDCRGNHPIITANCAVANPDFERIKANGYQNYYYEPFTETLKRYPRCEHSFELWRQGMQAGMFLPQFHAREHLNVARWMYFLQNDEETRHVFDLGLMGLFRKGGDYINNFVVALDNSEYNTESLENTIYEGLQLFEKIFGYKSQTYIAPCYTWHPSLEKILADHGVKGIQGMVYQRVPGAKSIRHWMVNSNKYSQTYIIRNVFFKPTEYNDSDIISDCLYRLKCAFRWHKPAIISAHRINFIGAIHEENRTQNLELLDTLLSEILKRWPDVEFMSSDELVTLIKQ